MDTIDVLRRLDKETSADVFLVGGFVRDFLRNKKNSDLDVVVRNMPRKLIRRYLKEYGSVKEVSLSQTNDQFSVNILLFRAEGDDTEAQISLPRQGKKQVPCPTNRLVNDAKFRDFKINALYLPVNFESKKDVIDFVGGKRDLEARRITVNGSATERLKESPIRMLRAISLASRTGYTIDSELIEAIKENAVLISKCPAEAIRNEFEKILMSRKPSRYLRFLNRTHLLKRIAPELFNCVGVKQDSKYHRWDVFSHLIYTVDHCERDLVIRLAGLLHDTGKPATRKEVAGEDGQVRTTFHNHEMESVKLARAFLKRFRYDKDTTNQVLSLVQLHMYHFTREWTDSAIRKFIKKAEISEDYLVEDKISSFPLFKLRAAERLGNGLKGVAVTDRQKDFEKKLIEVYNAGRSLDIKDLNVNGNTIMEMFNLQPGVQIGNILKHLLELVLEKPELNEQDTLLKLTMEYLLVLRKQEAANGNN